MCASNSFFKTNNALFLDKTANWGISDIKIINKGVWLSSLEYLSRNVRILVCTADNCSAY